MDGIETRWVAALWVLQAVIGAAACSGERQPGPDGEVMRDPVEGAGPTWHADVAPLVARNCGHCHVEGGIAPLALTDYETAKEWAALMADATESGRMPPFLAQDTEECSPRLPWYNDLRLRDAEKAIFRAWADAGAPEGDAEDAAELIASEPAALSREDIVLKLPEPITVDGTRDLHTCIVVDPNIERDTYVLNRLVTAGNARVLHHVVSYLIQPGTGEDGTPRNKAELEAVVRSETGAGIGERYDCFGGPAVGDLSVEVLDAWAPGALPNRAPPGSGQPLSKDALVLLDVHYHPTGDGPEVDADTYLALQVTDDAPQLISQTVLIGNVEEDMDYGVGVARLLAQEDEASAEFLIPAGATDHVEEMTWTWNELPLGLESVWVYGAGTHMHYVGYDMMVQLENTRPADGEPAQECLIHTPAWDFNWQRGYGYEGALEELPSMEVGDVLRMRCTYDNSLENPFVAQALAEKGLDQPVDVALGEDTLDEMCVVALGIIYPNPLAGD